MTALRASRLHAGAIVLLPLMAILAARVATHSDMASAWPRAAALLFLWVAADALTLGVMAGAKGHRPSPRTVLGAIATGFAIVLVSASPAVRAGLFAMPDVLAAVALTLAVWVGWSIVCSLHSYGSTRSVETALGEIIPPSVVRLAIAELAILRLALLTWRQEPSVPEYATAHSVHRYLNPMIAVLLGLQVIEIVVVHFLVSHWSMAVALALLAAGIYGVLFFVALMKAIRLRPVLLDAHELQVRLGFLMECRIPLGMIARIEPSISAQDAKRRDVFNTALLSHPNVILDLSGPVVGHGAFGIERMVVRVALRMDDAAEFLARLAEAHPSVRI